MSNQEYLQGKDENQTYLGSLNDGCQFGNRKESRRGDSKEFYNSGMWGANPTVWATKVPLVPSSCELEECLLETGLSRSGIK